MAKKYLHYQNGTRWGAFVKEEAGAGAFKEYEKERLRLTRYYDKLYGKGNYDYEHLKYEAANITLYGTEMRTEQARRASVGVTNKQELQRIATHTRLDPLLRSSQQTGATLDLAQARGKDGEIIELRNASLADILALYDNGKISLETLNMLIDDYKTFALNYRD